MSRVHARLWSLLPVMALVAQLFDARRW